MKLTLGWIGTGLMGAPMALHLAKSHPVIVYNRTQEKALALQPHVQVALNLNDLVEQSNIIFTMLGMPDDVDQMYREVLLQRAKPGTILVDLTTSSPALAAELAFEAKAKQLAVVDAPVTGGVKGAIEGSLTTMVGADEPTFHQIKPFLLHFTKTLLYMGGPGQGQQTKLANQIAIAGALVSLAEALAFAEAHHLPTNKVLSMIQTGAASSYASLMYGPKMLASDDEATFFVKHYVKDLRLAVEASPLELPVLKTVYALMDVLAKRFPNKGVQTIIHTYRQLISRTTNK